MKRITILFLMAVMFACGTDDNLVPKPPTYLRLDLPDHTYEKVENCGFNYDISKEFKQSPSTMGTMGDCSYEIDLGKLNGKLYVFYYQLKETDTLSKFINFANDKVDDHKLKATAINDEKLIRPDDRVFGTFFELQGDVATNYQFYLTDSSKNFMRAELLLNSRPNYDSLKPSLDYLKVDLLKMANTLQWKNK